MTDPAHTAPSSQTDSSAAWLRLAVAVLLSTLGGVGMWSYMVALPAIQSDFGIGRGEASLPFTLAMIGFACGGVLMGKLASRVNPKAIPSRG
jgi:MFS family permease